MTRDPTDFFAAKFFTTIGRGACPRDLRLEPLLFADHGAGLCQTFDFAPTTAAASRAAPSTECAACPVRPGQREPWHRAVRSNDPNAKDDEEEASRTSPRAGLCFPLTTRPS
jgi:hypothetical protein